MIRDLSVLRIENWFAPKTLRCIVSLSRPTRVLPAFATIFATIRRCAEYGKQKFRPLLRCRKSRLPRQHSNVRNFRRGQSKCRMYSYIYKKGHSEHFVCNKHLPKNHQFRDFLPIIKKACQARISLIFLLNNSNN